MKLPNAEKIIEKISEINHIYPEQITLHFIDKTPCPSCFDPVNKESTDINCSECGGDGYIETDNPLTIPVSVSGSEQDKEFVPIGTYFSNDLIITIDKLELDQYSIDVKKVDYFTFDGENYILENYKYGYLNGIRYEVKCLLHKKK